MKIGLLIIATNKYIDFLQELISGADENFLSQHEVTYFIFTNQKININTQRKVVLIETEHKSWPWMTLGRYKLFSENSEKLSLMDFLFYCDVDMRFESQISDEILSDLVATQHHGFFEKSYYQLFHTIELNPKSLAFIQPDQIEYYFAGGFNGGRSSKFLKMSKELSNNIEIDYSNDIIAVWHDESHLNKYLIQNKPSLILDPGYCYHEQVNDKRFQRKLVALKKNHYEIRN